MTRDEELRTVTAAQNGDESAFERLVLDQQKLVYNLALKLTGSADDALDVSQDVFLKAFLNLQSFRGESRLSVWLYRLTYNACMDHLRRNRPQNVFSLDADPEEDSPAMEVPDTRPLPAEEAERKELQEAVWKALDQLPEEKRRILVMREFSGLSYTEIAELLALEEGTVKSRLSRARLALAEVLRKNGTFEPLEKSNKQKGGHRNG